VHAAERVVGSHRLDGSNFAGTHHAVAALAFGCLVIAAIIGSAGSASAQTSAPSQEYIRLGGRVVAIERPNAETVSTPATPTGTTPIQVGGSASYSSGGSISSWSDSVQYRFTWGDGTTSDWLAVGVTSASHTWLVAGTYTVTVQARCATHTSVVSSSSTALTVLAQTLETITTPTSVSGPTSILPGTNYSYSTGGATSSWSDPVQYKFSWGDQTDSGWLAVGTTSTQHSWSASGIYTVTVQARCATHTSILSSIPTGLTVSTGAETITTPSAPSGPSGLAGTTYVYTASGAASSYGHTLQYLFNWGDGTNSGWLTRTITTTSHTWTTVGTFTVTVQARCADDTNVTSSVSSGLQVAMADPPPYLTTLMPVNGSGVSPTYQMLVTDLAGATSITFAQLVISPTSTLTSVGACHIEYIASVNALYLDSDLGGSQWVDGAVVGAGGRTIANSQCSVNTAGASVTKPGNTMTLNIPVTFKYAFTGTRYIYTSASNASGDRTWQYIGTWAVPEMITTPSTPSGTSTVPLATSYAYSTGSATSSLGHTVQYLFNWGDGTTSGWLTSGTTTVLHSWSSAGTYAVTAQARCVTDTSIVSSTSSSFSVTAESVSAPATPSGAQSVTAGIAYTYSTGGSTSTAGHVVEYKFTWGDGTNSGWLGSGVTSATHTWSTANTFFVTAMARCVTHTSVTSASSNSLTVTVPEIISTPTVTGTTSGALGTSYTYTVSGAFSNYGHTLGYLFTWGDGTNSGWITTASASHTWTTPGSYTVSVQVRCQTHTNITATGQLTVNMTDPLPTTISLSPTNGSGSSATFTLTASDVAGASYVTIAQLIVSPTYSITSVGACHLEYISSVNAIYLDGDSGGFWWVDNAVVGSGGRTIENSQCSVNTAGASVSRSGTTFTLSVPVTFKSVFNGTRYLYTSVQNTTGYTDWQYYGTWVVQ
jgi:hypothetical protein